MGDKKQERKRERREEVSEFSSTAAPAALSLVFLTPPRYSHLLLDRDGRIRMQPHLARAGPGGVEVAERGVEHCFYWIFRFFFRGAL